MSATSSPDRFATPASDSPISLQGDSNDTEPNDDGSDSVSVISEVVGPGDPGFIGPRRDHSSDWDEGLVEAYSGHFFYCINFNRAAGVPGPDSDDELRVHDNRCRLMYNFFVKHTVAKCVAVYFRDGSTQQDWEAFWARQRTRWTATSGRAFVHIYFNGKTHGKNDEYQWILDGFDHHINAYDFMCGINETNADVQYLLDCWIPTRWPTPYKWHRTHAMMEIICAGAPEPDEQGNIGPVHHGDFTPSFVRILGGFLKYQETGFEPPQSLQSTPQIMRWCKTLSNNAQRVWDLKPSTKSAKRGIEIWRIMTDPYICWSTRKLYYYRKKIQPKPEPAEGEDSQTDAGMSDVDLWDGEPEDLSELEDEEEEELVEEEEIHFVALHQDEGIEADMEDGPSGDADMDDVAHGFPGSHNGGSADGSGGGVNDDVSMADTDDT